MSILTAFLAGIASFISPCVLPLIPVYVTYIFGSKKKDILSLVLFVLGFSIVFVLMGASASQLGKIFISHKDIFRKISGIVIILFGLYMVGIFKPFFLNREIRLNIDNKSSGYFSTFLLGITFAAGWTPCVGPILASILIYASTTSTIGIGVILLFTYSMGLGIPFIIVALMIDRFRDIYKRINLYMPYIEKVSGIIMIIFGMLLYFNQIIRLNSYINFWR